MKRCNTVVCLSLLFLVSPSLASDAKRSMAIEDLFRFKRVADAQVSPDGQTVAYVLTNVSLAENKSTSNIWLAPTTPGAPKQLTSSDKKDSHPRWSPDGKQILFESNRAQGTQLWVIDVVGGEARQLTHIATDAGNGIWSPDGKWIAFTSAVYPEYSSKPFAESNAQNQKRLDEAAKNPVKARVFSRLFFRHWDEWVEDKRQHLFVIPAAGGEPKDVTPGDQDAYPTSTTFSVGDDFTFTPDSKALFYTAAPARNEAWSTNYDIYRVAIAGGKATPITKNLAADGSPRFSPNGQYLAYRAQERPGFEADRWQIMIMPHGGKPRSITKEFDGSPTEIVWGPHSDRIYFTAEEKARSPIFSVSVADGAVTRIYEGHTQASLSISRDGSVLGFTQTALQHPAEVCVLNPENGASTARNISQANAGLLAELDLPKPESVTVPGAGDTPMQMWILKPPGFDPAKKWPLAYLVHGGPQGAWEDGWSFRWNPELWAAQGYVVALPNPRGSTGFGQKYVDEISGDWGGKCFEDLMAGVAYLEKQPYIDPERMAAAGRLVRRLHDELVPGPHGQVQDAHHALRRLQLRQHVCHDRRTVVRRMGARRPAVGQSRRRTRSSRRTASPRTSRRRCSSSTTTCDFRVPVSEGVPAVHDAAAAGRAVAR